MNKATHPGQAQLILWADGELEGAEKQEIASHLAVCSQCRDEVAHIRETYREYNEDLRNRFGQPPAVWPSLRTRLDALDAGRVQQGRRSWVGATPWLSAAAAVLIAVLVVLRLSTGATVSAAELLRKASDAEAAAAPASKRKVRVKTRNALYVHDSRDLSARLRRAGYSWDVPLTVRSFALWRNGLRTKDDRVAILENPEFGRGRFYRVTTATPEGELSEASIIIRATDLGAVRERFTFRDEEWFEVTELPNYEDVETPAPPAHLAEAPAPQQHPVTASDELRVFAALHAITADLGDPVEITREPDRIRVRWLAADRERQSQIRTALSDLPFVRLEVEQPEAVRAETVRNARAADVPQTNALLDHLSARLGGRQTLENFTNRVLDLSDAALARAHALRLLAERFPEQVESSLPPPDRATLRALQADHLNHLVSTVRELTGVLKPVIRTESSVHEPSWAAWQSGADPVLKAAQDLDRSLTDALAGTVLDNPDAALNRVAQSAAELQSRVAGLQTALALSGARE